MSVRVRYTTRDGGLDTAGRVSHFAPSIGDAVCLSELGPHKDYPHDWGRVVDLAYFHFYGAETVTCIVEPCASPFDDPEGVSISVQETAQENMVRRHAEAEATTDSVMDLVREYGNAKESGACAYEHGNLGESKSRDKEADVLADQIEAAIAELEARARLASEQR